MPRKKKSEENVTTSKTGGKDDFKKTMLDQSNVYVEISLPQDLVKEFEKNVLKNLKQYVNLPGFRKGNAPEDLVRKKVGKEILKEGLRDEIFYYVLYQKLAKDELAMRYIGQPYEIEIEGINYDDNGNLQLSGDVVVKFKMDLYPDIEIKKGREKEKLEDLDIEVSQEEIDASKKFIKNRFAQYKMADKVGENTIAIIKMTHYGENDEILEVNRIYVGNEEYQKDEFFKQFLGKEKNAIVKLDYDENKFPADLKPKNTDKKPIYTTFFVETIEEKIEPEFNKEFFEKNKIYNEEGKPFENEEEFDKFMKKVLQDDKKVKQIDEKLQKFFNKLLEKKLINLVIPKTLLEEEKKHQLEHFLKDNRIRLEDLKGEEKEQIEKMMEKQVEENLKYGLIIRKFIEELGLKEDDFKNMTNEEFLEKIWNLIKSKVEGNK